MFPAVGLWQMRAKLQVPNIVMAMTFALVAFLTLISGFVDFSQITACIFLFLPQVVLIVIGFILAIPLIMAMTGILVHLGLQRLMPNGVLTASGRANPIMEDDERPIMVIGQPVLQKEAY